MCQSSRYEGCGSIKTTLPYILKDEYAPINGMYNVVRVRFLDGVDGIKSVIGSCPDPILNQGLTPSRKWGTYFSRVP